MQNYRYSILLDLTVICLILSKNEYVLSQRTSLDTPKNIDFYWQFRNFAATFIGRSGNDNRNFEALRKAGKLQKQFSPSAPFFCDVNGPGKRSESPPNSVHRLRPGDIDIVGALGDSLTAGNGVMAIGTLQVLVENKGVVVAIGGQDTWRKFLTVPNMLKEFNPNLYGYALSDGLSIQKLSRFNVAELGAMSRDIPHQARVIVQRLRNDPKVNMTHHWKFITILIGANDFCSDMCYYKDPASVIGMHERDMLDALRTLRDNIPRLMVNFVEAPSMAVITTLKGLPPECFSGLHFECPCFYGTRVQKSRKHFFKIIDQWRQADQRLINMTEFQNRDDFTINYQPFTRNLVIPRNQNDLSDFRYMSADCFHLSQKGHARATNALWNNMLEPEGEKVDNWKREFEKIKCPTKDRPFLATKVNSRSDFTI